MRRIKASKPKILFCLIAAACLLLCGCNMTGIGENDMLRPPRTTGDEAEIENLISKTVPKGYTLKYPKNGSHRSAIVMTDLDGDDTDEAIAFFREKDNVTGVHMLVMYKDSDTWKIASDFETETAEVDCVEFADINGSGTQEILAGYATYTPNVNFLSCYSYNKGTMQTVETGSPNYSAFYCGSLDNSGKSKVITLTLFTPEHEAKATMLEYDKGKNSLYSKSSVSMDPNIVTYKNVVFSDFSTNVKGIVVDGANASGEMNTQVIYFNRQLDVLRNPLTAMKPDNPTRRTAPVISADTDGDMVVDIPTVQLMPKYKGDNADIPADMVTWNTFNPAAEKLAPRESVAANYTFSYTIRLDAEWKTGSYTALCSDDYRVMTFYEINKQKIGKKLFEIRVFDLDDWEQAKSIEGYTLIYRDTRYAYTFANYSTDGDFKRTDDQIKTAFSVLDELAV